MSCWAHVRKALWQEGFAHHTQMLVCLEQMMRDVPKGSICCPGMSCSVTKLWQLIDCCDGNEVWKLNIGVNRWLEFTCLTVEVNYQKDLCLKQANDIHLQRFKFSCMLCERFDESTHTYFNILWSPYYNGFYMLAISCILNICVCACYSSIYTRYKTEGLNQNNNSHFTTKNVTWPPQDKLGKNTF